MKKILDICYGKEKDKSQYLDIYLPECDSFPVFLYFHGGGLEAGDKSGTQPLCKYLTQNGVAFVTANYRMYPTAKYPEFLEDAAEAVAWVFNNMCNYGTIKGIYVGGSSAGGYMSQMLCFDDKWLKRYEISPSEISGYVHDAGQPTCHFNVLRERGIDNRRIIIDDSAPLYHIGKAEKYSPMLFIVSDNDIPNRYEQTQLVISTLKHFKHTENIFTKLMHGTHTAYVDKMDENGNSIFGEIVLNFIKTINK